MNDEGVEKTEKATRSFVVWAISIAVIFIVVGGFLWALLYSAYFANLSFIIPIRNFYQEAYWKVGGTILGKKTYPPLDPIYTIQPQKPLQAGLNTYTMIGTLSKLDSGNGLLYVKGADQHVYVFSADNAFQADKDLWLMLVKVNDLQDLSSKIIPANVPGGPAGNAPPTIRTFTSTPSAQLERSKPPGSLIYSSKQFLISDNILPAQLTTIGIRWNDKKTLSQIESDYAKSLSAPLDDTSPESFVLAVFP